MVAAAVTLSAVAAACGSGVETGNALYSFTRPWGVGKMTDPVGQVWAAGGIPICTKGHLPVTITSITPVVIRGQIHLSRIAIRRVQRGGTIGTYPGLPTGSRQPAGYVVPSPSRCAWARTTDPIYETVIAASRTGARGGYIQGLRVRYRVGSARGEYVIPFTYALCGRDGPGPCRAR